MQSIGYFILDWSVSMDLDKYVTYDNQHMSGKKWSPQQITQRVTCYTTQRKPLRWLASPRCTVLKYFFHQRRVWKQRDQLQFPMMQQFTLQQRLAQNELTNRRKSIISVRNHSKYTITSRKTAYERNRHGCSCFKCLVLGFVWET